MITLLYFAWVRSDIGVAQETLETKAETVGELLAELQTRSDQHARALAEPARLRFAVNQTFVALGSPVRDGDEVAIFPPMTGG
jgi:molybdopterin synthase sulfur carrier subunit